METDPMGMGDNLAVAVRVYAKRWLFDVFPCRPRGKEPMLRGWQVATTIRSQTIADRWLGKPTANIGLPTGDRNGVFVLDIDGPEGLASLERLVAANGPLPKGPVQQTGGGGLHLFFRMPFDRRVRNSASRVAPKIDVRGEGGYIIVSPSVHPSGERYRWAPGLSLAEVAVPAAPDWLLDLVAPRPAPGGSTAAKTSGQWAALVAGAIPEGSRNATIASVAGHLLARNVDPVLVAELMQALNAKRGAPPLAAAEVEGIVVSIAKRELQRREWAT
ncbi:MAG: DNA primase [Alphaproteobacteria bacterium]|nr:DNA primase [Alphaproteobacteria bacterium]